MVTKKRAKKARPAAKRRSKKSTEDFDVEQWAKEQPSSRSRPHRCSVCDRPDIVPVVRRIMELRASGESQAGIEATYQMLKRQFNFERSISTLKRHMKQCEPKLWEQIDGQ